MSIDMDRAKLLLDVVIDCATVGQSVSNISQAAAAELYQMEAIATKDNQAAKAKADAEKAKAEAEAAAKLKADQEAAQKKLESASVTYTSDTPAVERKY